jgi:hypothetical protein
VEGQILPSHAWHICKVMLFSQPIYSQHHYRRQQQRLQQPPARSKPIRSSNPTRRPSSWRSKINSSCWTSRTPLGLHLPQRQSNRHCETCPIPPTSRYPTRRRVAPMRLSRHCGGAGAGAGALRLPLSSTLHQPLGWRPCRRLRQPLGWRPCLRQGQPLVGGLSLPDRLHHRWRLSTTRAWSLSRTREPVEEPARSSSRG